MQGGGGAVRTGPLTLLTLLVYAGILANTDSMEMLYLSKVRRHSASHTLPHRVRFWHTSRHVCICVCVGACISVAIYGGESGLACVVCLSMCARLVLALHTL